MLGALTDNACRRRGMTWKFTSRPCACSANARLRHHRGHALGRRFVSGAPVNPYRTRVENLSLGAITTRPASYRRHRSAHRGRRRGQKPPLATNLVRLIAANCPSVAAVAALRHVGTKVGFSSLGPEVALRHRAARKRPGTLLYPSLRRPTLGQRHLLRVPTLTVTPTSTSARAFLTHRGGHALMVSANGNLTPALVTDRRWKW